MKKILLLLTFIIACNSTIPCYAQSFFSDKNNVTLIAIMIAATISGIFLWYINIKTVKSSPKIEAPKKEPKMATRTFYLNNSIKEIIASAERGTVDFIKSANPLRDCSELHIRTDEETFNKLNITRKEKDGVSTIESKNNAVIPPNTSIEYNLYLTEHLIESLKSLTISGSLFANLGGLKFKNKKSFNLNSSGQSLITGGTFKNIDSFNITCFDNSKIKDIKGSANNATINTNTTAECIMSLFTINDTANVTTRGNSTAIIQTKQLSYDASDDSQIFYKGETTIINQKISNSANVLQIMPVINNNNEETQD